MIYYEYGMITIPKGISYNSADDNSSSVLVDIKEALESKGVIVDSNFTLFDVANYILTINGSNTEQNG